MMNTVFQTLAADVRVCLPSGTSRTYRTFTVFRGATTVRRRVQRGHDLLASGPTRILRNGLNFGNR